MIEKILDYFRHNNFQFINYGDSISFMHVVFGRETYGSICDGKILVKSPLSMIKLDMPKNLFQLEFLKYSMNKLNYGNLRIVNGYESSKEPGGTKVYVSCYLHSYKNFCEESGIRNCKVFDESMRGLGEIMLFEYDKVIENCYDNRIYIVSRMLTDGRLYDGQAIKFV